MAFVVLPLGMVCMVESCVIYLAAMEIQAASIIIIVIIVLVPPTTFRFFHHLAFQLVPAFVGPWIHPFFLFWHLLGFLFLCFLLLWLLFLWRLFFPFHFFLQFLFWVFSFQLFRPSFRCVCLWWQGRLGAWNGICFVRARLDVITPSRTGPIPAAAPVVLLLPSNTLIDAPLHITIGAGCGFAHDCV